MSGITVSRRGERLVAVKHPHADQADRCRAEAALLARLEHPGLVPFVDLVDHGDTCELHTGYMGTDTWARTPPATDHALIDGLAAVASTVADLHDLGVTHGALLVEHVIVGHDQRPFLCSLGDARPVDPSTEADDMAGLAGLIRQLSHLAEGDLRSPFNEIADRAATGELTARGLTDEINRLRLRTQESTTHRRRLVVVAAVVGVVIVGALAVVMDRSGTSEAALPTVSPSTSAPSSTTTSTRPTTTQAPAFDLDSASPAIEFIHEGRRYGLGQPGDLAVLGDWDCDGTQTPALFQSATETVAVFNRWPAPGESADADYVGPAPGATAIDADHNGDCHRLRIIDPSGSSLFVPEIP